MQKMAATTKEQLSVKNLLGIEKCFDELNGKDRALYLRRIKLFLGSKAHHQGIVKHKLKVLTALDKSANQRAKEKRIAKV